MLADVTLAYKKKDPNLVETSMLLSVFLEAVAQGCSVKKVFLEISQNSQENTCARVSSLQIY